MDIKDRVCPSCGEKLGLYSAMGLYMPLEGNAYRRIVDSEKEQCQNPFVPICLTSDLEWYSFVLSSTCKSCGHISLWKASKTDIDTLCSSENISNNFGFLRSYEPHVLKRILDNTEDTNVKNRVSSLLSEIIKMQGD